MKPTKPVIIFLGPQGSGKGTQGKRLAEKLNINYLETGKLLRDEIASGSERGRVFGPIINAGGHLADADVSAFMKDTMEEALAKAGGFLLDGFPRSVGQADAAETVASPSHVVLIDIPDQESIRRLSARRQCPTDGRVYNLLTDPPKRDELCDDCGAKLVQRADDTPEGIQKRLDWYHGDTKPLIDRYEARGILHRVDGTPSIPEVEQAVWEIFA
ncbi:MAG: nucleoside monophosphate kinase [Parcubacteria group bacterium]|nr:nucleoside monophosphate kinase [Parcubacteria group bacterium]